MRRGDTLRRYLLEPILALLLCGSLLWRFGGAANAGFMHAEARDILALLLVLLAASLAIWVGLFWVSNTAFGRWLSERSELVPINNAFVINIAYVFAGCCMCIVSAYLDAIYVGWQVASEFFGSLAVISVGMMIKNAIGLLKLHGFFIVLGDLD